MTVAIDKRGSAGDRPRHDRKRSPALPDVPAVAEPGVAAYDFPIWYGVWAPAGTSSEIVQQLADDTACAITEATVCDWLVSHGMEAMRMAPAAFAQFVADEARRAERITEASKARLPD